MNAYKGIGNIPKAYLKVSLVFIVICFIISAICFQYYRELHNTIQEESRGYLQEISRRIASNIDRIIADNFAILYTMSSIAEAIDEDDIIFLPKYLKKYKEHWYYQTIMLINEQGQAFDLDGNECFLMLDDSVRKKMISGESAMSTTQIVNNREYILFSVPVSNGYIKEQGVVALAASYDLSSFTQTLSMNSFNEQAYSQIITKSGISITKPSNYHEAKTGYNVFSTLEKAILDKNSDFDTMKSDISKNKSNLVGFTIDEIYRYMVYTPLTFDDLYLLTFVPVKVVSEKSDILLKTTIIICTLITIIFAALSATIVYVFNNNKKKLEKIAYVDQVTLGNTIQKFHLFASSAFSASSSHQYAIIYTNIAKFKLLNEQFGRQNCDAMLKLFYEYIQSFLSDEEIMGRLSADNFCILIQFDNEGELLERIKNWRVNIDDFNSKNLPWELPTVEFGIYIVSDRNIPISQMIDRAKLSLKESLWSIDNKTLYAFYDDAIRHKMIREKYLEDKMEKALFNREFHVYLQPKYSIREDKIGGAESLVRWISKDEGTIYPNEFIPLFEKNGFVVQIDLFMFEEVCRIINSWRQRGLPIMKISVNCSRVHFRYPYFLEPYIQIAEIYDIDKKKIEIEITESVVFEDSEHLINIINQIRDAGFSTSMDDFGSGYSSLNLIQNIPIDTIKLDKSFFVANNSDFGRVESVVKSVISMAKALSMETVAEGVEHPEQMKMLKDAGCDYIQGYVYAKPMNLEAFEKFAFEIDTNTSM